MIDIARSEGYEVDHKKLEELLGVPVVPMIAVYDVGIDELRKTIISSVRASRVRRATINYGAIVEETIRKISDLIMKNIPELSMKYPLRWLAIKFLEGDEEIHSLLRNLCSDEVFNELLKLRREAELRVGDLESYISSIRFRKAIDISKQVIRYFTLTPKTTITDIIDSIVTHRLFGIPFALAVTYLLFRFAFEVSTPLVNIIDLLINNWLYSIVKNCQYLPNWLTSFLADGVISGVGTVLSFLPVIAFFFLGLAILEDIGYLARLAFVIDKIFHKYLF